MAGALPTSPGPSRIELSDITGAVVSRSLSGKRFARLFGGQRWRMRVKYPPRTRDRFAPILGFIASQQGQFGTFTVVPTDLATPSGTWAGAPVVSGAVDVGAMTVPMSGFMPNVLGVAKMGDLIKFAGHAKAYMVVASVSADAGGFSSIQLNTPLVGALANAELVVSSNVPITVALDGGVQSYSVGRGGFYQFDFDATEAV